MKSYFRNYVKLALIAGAIIIVISGCTKKDLIKLLQI